MIGVEDRGGVRIVTIDRADKANSLTYDMLAAIRDAARGAVGCDALILTASGTKVFSAGMDLEAAETGLATDPVWEEASGAIATLPCLTVAALNGTLAGGAFGVALACDVRLSVPGARFFYPVAHRGYLPQPSDPARLSALIGPARAKLLLAMGAKTSAEEALAWGLVDRLVEDPVTHALELIAALHSGAHTAAIKAMV